MIKELNEYSRLDYNTPLRPDAFELTDSEKIQRIEASFLEIMQTLGLDMTDDSLKGTPKRVAKMYVKEIFSGLDARNFPKATLFENKFGYKEMLVEKDITFYSNCEHHFVPFFGKAHVAYLGADKVIGLSKLNRIVQYFAQRPQVQERLTNQIGKELQNVLQTENVAVFLEANHLCVASRGIKDTNSSTITTFYGGRFMSDEMKNQFLNYISV
jgi:GTP cyclohydrolase IA